VADCSWKIGSDAYVETDLEKSQAVLKSLNVPYDPQVFPVEHGASVLMPYINKYFPGAKVVVVAVRGEPPLNILYNQPLADAIMPFFNHGGKDKNFLLISSDFSHHSNIEKTNEKDDRFRAGIGCLD
jgi:AmmeMemoRadiSam system protein B